MLQPKTEICLLKAYLNSVNSNRVKDQPHTIQNQQIVRQFEENVEFGVLTQLK